MLLCQEIHLLADFKVVESGWIADGNLSGVKVGNKPLDAVDLGCVGQERGADEGSDKAVCLAQAAFVKRQMARCEGQGKSGQSRYRMEANGFIFFPPGRAGMFP